MDRNLIYSAIENPRLRAGISIEEMENVREMYPYFTAAQILLAKLYQEKNDHRFADQLQKAAVYALDRKTLYQYITGEQEEEQRVKEQGNKEQGNKEQGNKEEGTREEEREREVQIDSLPIHGQVEDTTEREQEQEREQEREREREILNSEFGIQNDINSLPIHGQVEDTTEREEEEEQEQEVIHAKDLDDMTQNILVEAIQSSIELEVEEENENDKQEEEEIAFEGEPKTYAEWMMWKAAKQKGTLPIKPEEKSKSASDVANEISERAAKVTTEKTDVTGPSVTVQKMQVTGPRAHQQSLIDKFIQHQPKITPGKASEYPIKDNLGKDSMEDDMTFVTETMAKLFAQQGKIDKARKVYRQLMVLHPEKSVYFAAQLKNLNQLKK